MRRVARLGSALALGGALALARPAGAAGERHRIAGDEASLARGRAVFEQVCRACHGLRYLGQAPPLTEEQGRAAFGKAPPDLTLMALARGREKAGAAYIAALLEGYEDTPRKNRVLPGIAMPAPLEATDPDRGGKAADVAAYLLFVADPHAAERRRLGRGVLAYLALLTALLYLVNRRVWRDLKSRTRDGRGPSAAL